MCMNIYIHHGAPGGVDVGAGSGGKIPGVNLWEARCVGKVNIQKLGC